MTDVTTGQTPAVDEQLVRELTARARAEGLALTGEGGLLQQLTKIALVPRATTPGYPTSRPQPADLADGIFGKRRALDKPHHPSSEALFPCR